MIRISDHRELSQNISESLDLIARIVKSIESGSLSTTIDNRIVKISPLEFLFVYTSMSQKTSKGSSYRKPLIDLFQSLESAFPGSAFIAAKFLVNDINRDYINSLRPHKMNSKSIFEAIKKVVSLEENSVIKAIIETGGLYRHASFDTLKCGDNYVIKGSSKESLGLNVSREFLELKSINTGSAVVLVSDMVFEKMSEIDNVVRWSQSINKPLVLVSRGFLPEVANTLFYNYLNKKLSVVPCTVEYSDSDPFNLDDVSLICNTQMILGPISVYDDEALSNMSGELKEIVMQDGDFKIMPKDSNLEIGKMNFKEMDSKRVERLSKGSIRVSLPENSTLLQKSRIRNGVALYRIYAREASFCLDEISYPIPIKALQRILKSVAFFRQESKRHKFCIKV